MPPDAGSAPPTRAPPCSAPPRARRAPGSAAPAYTPAPRAPTTPGEAAPRIASAGLALGAMVEHARQVGGPAVRALTFHERAGLLKELAQHLTGGKDEAYALSTRTGATHRDSLVDIDGGIGTVFSFASKAKRELPNDTVVLDGPLEQLGRGGRCVGQAAGTHRTGGAGPG